MVESPKLPRGKRGRVSAAMLAADAWLDSSLYEARFRFGRAWENITIFSRRFRVRGWRRGLVELASEGFTMGAAGSVVMLALAIPAFQETTKDWRNQGDFAVTFLDRYGNEIGQRGIIQRDSVPIDAMPDHVIQAVLATEDRRFFTHWGIDFLGLGRAMGENMRANGVVQGGSTLTQQLAKNLFLTNERTFERKIKEAFLAVWLETNLTKKDILQLYLDRGYMGGGTFGITAAADFYFGKSVKDLNLSEAAMLAGLFKAPAKYAPHINLPAARGRANEVLSNLVQGGFLTEGQVLSARLHPASVVDRGERPSPDFFLDWAFEQAKQIAEPFGIRSMVARTTIDLNLQHAAEESLEFMLRQHGKQYRVEQGALVMLETNGAVRALVGGRDYGTSQFNRATKALRQSGSSFKPYVYATAMENGFKPESVISDGPINWNGWSPQNYARSFSGRMTLSTALIKSTNTVPVRLTKEHLGVGPVKAMAESFGVESKLESHKTMVLGTSGMTVMDQATGYEVFANGGYAGMRHGITQLANHSAKVFYDRDRDAPKPRRVLSEQATASMNSILVQIPEIGTARRAALPGIRTAGKTGTTQAYRDAWFVGFTGNYLAAVWMGNDDFKPTNEMTGGVLPAMVWQRLMAYAHRNVELKPIPGIEKPFIEMPSDPQAIASLAADGGASPTDETPRILSPATTRVLAEIEAAFGGAKPASASLSDKLSAL